MATILSDGAQLDIASDPFSSYEDLTPAPASNQHDYSGILNIISDLAATGVGTYKAVTQEDYSYSINPLTGQAQLSTTKINWNTALIVVAVVVVAIVLLK